jgi:hypothetical protein
VGDEPNSSQEEIDVDRVDALEGGEPPRRNRAGDRLQLRRPIASRRIDARCTSSTIALRATGPPRWRRSCAPASSLGCVVEQFSYSVAALDPTAFYAIAMPPVDALGVAELNPPSPS